MLQVTGGCSHVILQGCRPDKVIECWGWGRCDMGQLCCLSSIESTNLTGKMTRSIVPLPEVLPNPQSQVLTSSSCSDEAASNVSIAEVWCGSEYTMCSDGFGRIWSCGWNEHKNLGHQSDTNGDHEAAAVSFLWKEVMMISLKGNGETLANWKEQEIDHQLQIGDVWEGALACGGGHCLATVHPQL